MTAIAVDILEAAVIDDDRIVFEVLPECAVAGERRIGYASIMQLVERVRELHWSRDVLPPAAGRPVDSITRSLSADFLAPFTVHDQVVGGYRVQWCRQRSYGLQVAFRSSRRGIDLARVDLVSVFYDPVLLCSTSPPMAVLQALNSQARVIAPRAAPTA
jgi:acyl-CoA thioesterase FadM